MITIESQGQRKCMKSLTSGEVRWFPKSLANVDQASELFEWAREEIICAFEADVPCIVFDEMGAEIINSCGLDAALRACVWKAREQGVLDHIKFLVVADESVLELFTSLYMFEDSEVEFLESWDNWLENSQRSHRRVSSSSNKEPAALSHHGEGTMYSIMRIPFLFFTIVIIGFELVLYLSVRQIVRTLESVLSKNRHIRQEMNKCSHYSSWRRLARQLDVLEAKSGGNMQHIPTMHTLAKRLKDLTESLDDSMSEEGEHEILRCLRECTMASNNDQITEQVYSMNFTGTNVEVQEYTGNIVEALEAVGKSENPRTLNFKNLTIPTNSPSGERPSESDAWLSPVTATLSALQNSPVLTQSEAGKALLKHLHLYREGEKCRDDGSDLILSQDFNDHKRRFFGELLHSYGEMALCLSGGASNAYYHLGVVQCLLEKNLLPRHISGASGGALVGSFLCTHTDDELVHLLHPEILSKIFNPCEAGMVQMMKNGLFSDTIFDLEEWSQKLQNQICGNLTFQEAFERTGRSFTITVYNIDAKGRNHTRCLNHKTTPDIVIYSAVLASSALPKLLPAIELLRKDARGVVQPYHSFGRFWRDGSFENELPFEAIHQLFNTSFHLVSQVEPHIIPFFYENRGAAGKSVSHRKGRGWRGGFVLSYFERLLKLDLKKWLELVRDFNLLPKVMETDISSIFLGKTRGSCTMVAPVIANSYFNLVSDPNTPEKFNVYLKAGRQMAWPKLEMIKNHMKIERKLMQLAGIEK